MTLYSRITRIITMVMRSMMYTVFILPISPLVPPNTTALLSSIVVKVKAEHGGGLSPVVTGQLHTPVHAVSEKENQASYY